MKVLTLDFESHAIEPLPQFPPQPVGVSLKLDAGPSKYHAFGHPSGNTCDEQYAKNITQRLIHEADKLLMHNAAFDVAILKKKWGIFVPAKIVNCSMVEAFINDPYGELSLKPLCEKTLGMPPTERDDVRDYIIRHGHCPSNSKSWGAHISKVPGDLVKPYAEGDTDRTYALHTYLQSQLTESQLEACDREYALMPIIHDMEQRGVHVDVKRLERDVSYYQSKLQRLDSRINVILNADVDVDSNEALADAIERAGKSSGFGTTAKGRRSVAKSSLIGAIDDPQLLGHILTRNSLATAIRTFMWPWYEQADANDGLLYIKWNQVRNYSDTGARTGRISTSPNLQNVPVKWEALLGQLDAIGYKLDFDMPEMRSYIIPAPGNIFVSRDYSAQEMRLLAHFAGGKLLESLNENPLRDIHMVAADIAQISRRVAKTLGFAVLYGAGVGRIAESLGISVEKAHTIKQQYLAALPEVATLQKDVTKRGKTGSFIRTLGGRLYRSAPPTFKDGVYKTFEYKMTNYLIQGSAADQTKQAMINFNANSEAGYIQLQVHDQLVVEVDIARQDEAARELGEAMNSSFQDVLEYKVISDESRGFSFAALK